MDGSENNGSGGVDGGGVDGGEVGAAALVDMETAYNRVVGLSPVSHVLSCESLYVEKTHINTGKQHEQCT